MLLDCRSVNRCCYRQRVLCKGIHLNPERTAFRADNMGEEWGGASQGPPRQCSAKLLSSLAQWYRTKRNGNRCVPLPS